MRDRWRRLVLGTACVAVGACLGIGQRAYALPNMTGGTMVMTLPFTIPAANSYSTLIVLLPNVGGNTIATWTMQVGRDILSPYVGFRLVYPAGYLTAYPQSTTNIFTYRSIWDTVFAYGGAGTDQELANQMTTNGEVRRVIENTQATYIAGGAFWMRFWIDPNQYGNATVLDREFFLFDCAY